MAQQLPAQNAAGASSTIAAPSSSPSSSSSSSWLLFFLKASLLLALLLLALSKFLLIMPYLAPSLTSLSMSLLHRLFDVLRFLAITTTLTVGILSSNKRNIKKNMEGPLHLRSLKDIDVEVQYEEAPLLHQRRNLAGDEDELQQQQLDPSPKERLRDLDSSQESKGVVITTGPTLLHDKEGQDSSSSLRKRPHHHRASSIDAVSCNKDKGLDGNGTESSAMHSSSSSSKEPHHRRASSTDAMFCDKMKGLDDFNTRSSARAVTNAKPAIVGANMVKDSRGESLVGANSRPFENSPKTTTGSNASASVNTSRSPTTRMNAANATSNVNPNLSTSEAPPPPPPASSAINPKHNRSKSALDLQLESRDDVPMNLESKPAATRRRRRVTSLSCDFGREKLINQWLCDLPSPPAPPPDIANDPIEDPPSVVKQLDDPKAFIDSLVPWRSTSLISAQEEEGNGAFCPSPNVINNVVIGSPRELGRKADAFIARFHQQMKLQRKESFERYKRRQR